MVLFLNGCIIGLISFVVVMFGGPRIIGEADLILMIMRMTDKYLINVHDEHEGKHSDDHGEWEIAIAVQITGRSDMLILLIEIQIKVKNSFGYDIKQSDR